VLESDFIKEIGTVINEVEKDILSSIVDLLFSKD